MYLTITDWVSQEADPAMDSSELEIYEGVF